MVSAFHSFVAFFFTNFYCHVMKTNAYTMPWKQVASKISHFWRTVSDSRGQQHTSPTLSSRYLNDFEELQPLGESSFDLNCIQVLGSILFKEFTYFHLELLFHSYSFCCDMLGHGGFGHVVLCKNKLDGRQYAVKKIRLKDKSQPLDDRILR